MKAQAWILTFLFTSAVIFSIVMASISKTFRFVWSLDNIISYVIFFLIIITAAIIFTMSAQCSVTGQYDRIMGTKNMCGIYAWVLTGLITTIVALYITYGVIMYVKEKKLLEVSEEEKNQ